MFGGGHPIEYPPHALQRPQAVSDYGKVLVFEGMNFPTYVRIPCTNHYTIKPIVSHVPVFFTYLNA